MRGSIKKRGDAWFIRFDVGIDPATGKRIQQAVTFHGNQKQAEAKLTDLLNQIDRNMYVKPGKLTVAEYMEQWLKDYCWPNLAPRSAETYEYLVRKHINPAIGRIPLTSLKPRDIQQLYTEKQAAGLGNRTVAYLHVTLHKSLKTALRMGMVNRNVADAVEPPRIVRHEMKIMSPEDIERFLDLAKDTPYYALFYTLITTGLRRGEALALHWGDLDLLGAELTVARSIQQLDSGKMIISQPKTEKSRRTIAISPSTALVLRQHKEVEEAKRQALGQTFTDNDYVFRRDNGEPYLPDSITHAFTQTAKRAGLEGIHLHSARHTMASLMLKLNVHPLTVSRMLGHSNIQTTLNIYSHLSPGLEAAAAGRLDELITNRRGSEAKIEAIK